MKRFFLLAAFGALLCFVLSCQKTPTAELSLSQNDYSVEASGGSVNVSVSTNVDLTVRVSAGWIVQAGSPSGGSGTYGFTVARNDTYDARTATITFSNAESGVSETVTVTQAQQDAIIPGSLEYKLFYEEQTFSLPVAANVDYSVSVSGGDWIKSLGTRGLTTKNCQFSIAENTGKTPREAIVTITAGSLKQSIKVEQLPTTHKPKTKEEWKESINSTDEIAKSSKAIIDKYPKNQVTGWDVDRIAHDLSELDGVIRAYPDKSGKMVYIMQRDSSLIPVVLEFDEINQGINSSGDELSGSSLQTSSSLEISERKNVSPNGKGKKALLLAPYHHETKPIKIEHKTIKKDLISIGYKEENIKYLEDSQVTLDYVYGDNLAAYDLVIINTHGGMWNYEFLRDPETNELIRDSEGNLIGIDETHFVLCLGPMQQKDIDSFLNKYDDEKKEGLRRYIEGNNTCRAVGKKWFEGTTSDNTEYPNSLFFAFACHSFEKDDLFDYFTDNSAAEYCGFTSDVYKSETPPIINSMISALSKGMSFQDAADYTFTMKTYEAKKIFRAKPKDGLTSSDVFLVDPRAFELKETPKDMLLSLEWSINKPAGKCLYDVYLDDKLYKAGLNADTHSTTVKVNTLSTGEHSWYVVTHIIDEGSGQTLAYYNSDVRKFKITGPTVAVTGIKIRPSAVSIEPGETYQLTATVMPDNATNKAVTWKSNHPELVSVDENGLITAIKRQVGTTVYITAKTVDGGKSATCQVTVKEPSGGEVAVTGISLSPKSAEIEVGKTQQLKATITPSNATNKSVEWSSSNTAVATVDINGLVTGKALGTAKITAKTEDGGKTATVSITVKKAAEDKVPVTGVSIDKSTLSLEVGESATLTATVSPSNATNKGVTWTSSMTAVATVTSDGVVTAKAAGTATITAKTDDGGKTATCNVTVTYTPGPGGEINVSQVTISPTSANMTVGDTKQFSVKIDPANATNQEVSWSSSDPTIASIDSKGLVTAKAEGKATITVTAKDGGVSSKATVTVSNKVVPVTGVTVSPTSMTMEIGDSKSLTVSVKPTDATDMTYTVTSDDTGVVDIDKDNNLVAKGAGTANVTVTTTDGGHTATCAVTVNKPQMTIEASPTSLSFGEVNVGENATKTFSIKNTGKADVKVSDITVPDAYSIDMTTPFTIAVGKSQTVTVTFTPTEGKDYSGTITISSDADSQPTVSLSGTGVKQSEPSVTFEAVDLGLSVKWANMNLGANRPEEFGDYYAWGETDPKKDFTTENYKWYSGNGNDYLTKYCTSSNVGKRDDLVALQSEDDAAHVKHGGKWRMPTKDEVRELLYSENCTYSFTSINGNNCVIVTSKITGKSITLPAAGVSPGNVLNVSGWYWTLSLNENSSRRAYFMYFLSDGIPDRMEWDYIRTCGLSIRPVYGDLNIPVESVSLDKTELELSVGESASLVASIIPSNATNTSVTWASSKESVAKVSSSGVVTGVSSGSAIITVTTTDGGMKATCSVTVTDNSSSTNEFEAVDLGLSVKWANMNLGASSPEEDGDFYAWGETEPYYSSRNPLTWKEDKRVGYDWPSYSLCNGSSENYDKITKYCTDSYIGADGFTDGKTILDPEDDVAHVILGGKWRMPTKEEVDELTKECTWEVTKINEVTGWKVTSPNGHNIFFPINGMWSGRELSGTGYHGYGYYWTSTLYTSDSNSAYLLGFTYYGTPGSRRKDRDLGFSIRPVMEK